MDKQNIARRAVKRRRTNSTPNQNPLRKKVDISDDTWLETLKYLSCLEWSQKCFVSRQINGVAQRNILRLPMMTLHSALMYYRYWTRSNLFNSNTTVVFDTVMQEEQSMQWFKSRGFTLDAPKDIPAQNVVIGVTSKKSEWKGNVNVCIYGSAHEKIPLTYKEHYLPWYYDCSERKPVLFYAKYNPFFNQYSSNYLAQFLKCIYHPALYIKKVEMYAFDQSFIDSLKCNADSFDNKPRYIRCESFMLLGISGKNTVALSNSLQWLGRNVRAETIQIREIDCDEKYPEAYVLLANFLLEASGASKKTVIRQKNEMSFLNALIQKFRTIPVVKSAIPTIEFWYPRAEEYRAHLGPNLIAREVDSEGADALYMIENGQNRMRISLKELPPYMCPHNINNPSVCNVNVYSI
ncbi:hypothetical protein Ddc_11389 [Ditylenchus destructor]|nr:hypothetical protein Ddc_11389 [Ditylenchus destructor]